MQGFILRLGSAVISHPLWSILCAYDFSNLCTWRIVLSYSLKSPLPSFPWILNNQQLMGM